LYPLKAVIVSSGLHWNFAASLFFCRKVTNYLKQSFSEAQSIKNSTRVCRLSFINMLTKSRRCYYFLVTTSCLISLKFIIMLPSLLPLVVAGGSFLQASRPKLHTNLYPALYGRNHHRHEIR
jgi:hypothetical protein